MKIEIDFDGEQKKGSDYFYYRATMIFNGKEIIYFESLSSITVIEKTIAYVENLMVSEDI